MGKSRKKKPWLSEHQFNKGHPYVGPAAATGSDADSDITTDIWMPRMDKKQYELAIKRDPKGNPSLPDADGICSGAKILRPKKEPTCEPTEQYQAGNGEGEMRFVHKEKIVELMNNTIAGHIKEMGQRCEVPVFEINSETKKGLCWVQSLKCKLCSYVGPRHKLYEEVETSSRGPKYAKPNLALQVGLQDCPIGNTKARLLLLSTNTPIPSRSSMQKASNKVATLTSKAAEADLANRRKQLKEVNKTRNISPDAPVNITVDVRYNTTSITSHGKMGQSATQALGVAIEGQTDSKQIVGICFDNKLCKKGAQLRANGKDVKCPGGHPGCTATREMAVPFSEYDIGKKLGNDIANDNIFVRHVTTDGDSRSSEGVKDAMRAKDPFWSVIRQADTTHLSQSQFRRVQKAKFSQSMLPGRTKEERNDQQKLLGADIKQRSHIIFQTMYAKTSGNMAEMRERMPEVIETTLDCYAGDCSKCKKKSIVCQGEKKPWISQSMHLRNAGVTALNINDDDRKIMKELLSFYLGEASLDLMKLNSNTNKNESVNRAVSASLPKNVLFSRNGKARALTAVSRLNNGIGNSLIASLESVGAPLSKGGSVAKGVRQLQKCHTYHRAYVKTDAFRYARYRRRYMHMKEHMRVKALRRQGDYQKRQLDPPFESLTSQRKALAEEHCYYDNSEIKTINFLHLYNKNKV